MFGQVSLRHRQGVLKTSRKPAYALFGVTLALSACGSSPPDTPVVLVGHPPQASHVDPATGDGFIPQGKSISPFDDDNPAIANLKPDIRHAMQAAAKEAGSEGIAFRVNSGWRSAKYQELLLDRAIATYGSEQTALRFVDTPEKSAHVKGEAVDIGPQAADDWLEAHGNAFGLCRIYANEVWHFQLSTEPGGICPALIADAASG